MINELKGQAFDIIKQIETFRQKIQILQKQLNEVNQKINKQEKKNENTKK